MPCHHPNCLAHASSLTKQIFKLLKSSLTPPVTFLLSSCLTKGHGYRKQSADYRLTKLEPQSPNGKKIRAEIGTTSDELQDAIALNDFLQLLMLMTRASFLNLPFPLFYKSSSHLSSWKLPSKCHFIALLSLHIFSYFWVPAPDNLFFLPSHLPRFTSNPTSFLKSFLPSRLELCVPFSFLL